jgi:dATP pyrophosphohydrolase
MQGTQDPPAPAGVGTTPPVRLRRPESVLIVIYTSTDEFLLIERVKPPGFWQSVTGSLEWGELADDAARREVLEETGISDGSLRNLQWTQTYEISPSFGRIYAAGVTHNLEHAFALKLPRPCAVRLCPKEHARFRWLAAGDALAQVSSHTNRAVIEYLKR